MARKKSSAKAPAYVLFHVTYEDGMVTSNRKVPGDQLDETFGDDILSLARTAIEDQDNMIAERSGQRRAKIKSVARA